MYKPASLATRSELKNQALFGHQHAEYPYIGAKSIRAKIKHSPETNPCLSRRGYPLHGPELLRTINPLCFSLRSDCGFE